MIRRMDAATLPLSEVSRLSLTIRRTMAIRNELRAEVADVPLSPVQAAALSLLAAACAFPRKRLVEAAKNGDKIGKHTGQSARWTAHLAAVDAIRAGGAVRVNQSAKVAVRTS
jgi:hypothetical protein